MPWGYTGRDLDPEAMFESTGGVYGRKRRVLELENHPRVARPVKRYVKRVVNATIEKQILQTGEFVGNAGVPTTAGRVDPVGVFNITQGDTEASRHGNTITVTRLIMRLFSALPAASSNAEFRAVLFRDRQCNGATPIVANVLGASAVQAGYNSDHVVGAGGRRFQILWDKYFVINASAAIGATPATIETKKCFTVVKKKIGGAIFDASAGAITDINSGELFLLTISNNNTAVMQARATVEFHDG